MPSFRSAYVPSPRRMCIVARATFTQLLRMKIFIFLAAFSIVILLIACIRPEHYLGQETHGVQSLILLKNTSFAAIRIFGLAFCVMATALIIPKDTEDRILYTILSKPVHRVDYLAGKALGVIALALCATLLMDGLMCAILWFRESTILMEQQNILTAAGYSASDMRIVLEQTKMQGLTWNLQSGIFVLFSECVVLTSMTLLLSCLTNGTIISALLSFGIYIIGIFQSQAKILWFSSGGEGMTAWDQIMSQGFTLVFPNYGIYSVSDSAVNGQNIPVSILGELGLVTLAYFVFHIVVSAWVFRKKEF